MLKGVFAFQEKIPEISFLTKKVFFFVCLVLFFPNFMENFLFVNLFFLSANMFSMENFFLGKQISPIFRGTKQPLKESSEMKDNLYSLALLILFLNKCFLGFHAYFEIMKMSSLEYFYLN